MAWQKVRYPFYVEKKKHENFITNLREMNRNRNEPKCKKCWKKFQFSDCNRTVVDVVRGNEMNFP